MDAMSSIRVNAHSKKNYAVEADQGETSLLLAKPAAVLLIPPELGPSWWQRREGREGVLSLAIVLVALQVAHTVGLAVARLRVGAVN